MRGFTDDERDRIRDGLVETGQELFTQYGLKKTTIAELTEPVGIAPSTFYQFFDSKEELYAEILERESEEIVGPIMANSFESTDDPEEAIRQFLRLLLDEIESNPLLRHVLVDGTAHEYVARGTEAEKRAEREDELAQILPYVERWQEQGKIGDTDPTVVASVIRAAVFITLHQDDIGEDLYPDTRNLLIDAVAAGLSDL
ncbi:transcriptional regulator, TetR family [Halogranum rubrum]|uniref:Transcriptional regulator, TetR family n=1 Tax=Halogranum rubrum TaxID=553466 RepID=A0A1I4I8U0_9EURY|nr:TetR/AcrR family transcriptional regulator [Halogranum rubrum]SFL50116.1 transcriptional regulator, TetR family [Halogranum rubrum]